MFTISLLILCLYSSFPVIQGTSNNNNSRFLEFASDYLLDGLNKTSNPCDNAFGFLCSKWVTSVESADENEEYAYLEQKKYFFKKFLQDDLFRAVNAINPQTSGLPKYKLWLRTYYDRCLALPVLTEDQLLEQVYSGLQRNIEPPPFLVTQNRSLYDQLIARDVWYFMGRVQRSAVGGVLFEVNIMNVLQTPTMVFEPVSKHNRMNETTIKSYLNKFAGKLGITNKKEEIDGKIRKVLDFERDLMKYVEDSQENDQGEYMLFNSSEQLAAFNPNISWDKFFRGLFSTDDQYVSWDRSKAFFRVYKRNMNFFLKLDEFLSRYDAETIFNYAFCNCMKKLHEEAKSFKTDLLDGQQSLNETCLRSVSNFYNTALLKIYFDAIGENGLLWQEDVRIIVTNVISAFGQEIGKLTWLTNEERNSIKNSLQEITYKPAIPDWFNSETEIEKNTIKFDPAKGTFDNYINIKRRMFYLELERYIDGSLEQNDRLVFIDVGYYGNKNLTFMLGSMLPPLYHRAYPAVLKYAVLGTKIAQALLRAFDENNFLITTPQNTWEKILDVWEKQRDCLDKQVKNIDCPKVPQQCHDISSWYEQTLLAQLSDIDGLKLSHSAYQLAITSAKQSTGPSNLGLKADLSVYSEEEIFFMFAGRSTCFSYYFENSLEDGGQTKDNGTRLSKVIRNVPDFGKAFKCNKNSSSYLENSCSVWIN